MTVQKRLKFPQKEKKHVNIILVNHLKCPAFILQIPILISQNVLYFSLLFCLISTYPNKINEYQMHINGKALVLIVDYLSKYATQGLESLAYILSLLDKLEKTSGRHYTAYT